MLNCFSTTHSARAVPIKVIAKKDFADWLAKQSSPVKDWLNATQFRAEANNVRLIPDAQGRISMVVCCVDELTHFWNAGSLPMTLPEGVYQFEDEDKLGSAYPIAWGLGAYQFTRYKQASRQPAQLFFPEKWQAYVQNMVESIYLVRDCINTPADDMGPSELAEIARKLANDYGANFKEIIGQDLLQQNYPCIYTVGRASDDAPRLLDIKWGEAHHPKVTLVGKGVCFDSGGLDLKPSSYMLLMKKDMGGSAHVLGLARMIMQAQLPICLRVLIPAVENAVSGNAYRPGDVIKSRKGLTIEVGNTDAEGRLVLADALTEAVSDNPDLIIDMSTLTGAARVALGTELPAVFANNDEIVNAVIAQGQKHDDPMWRMPLFALYRDHINSQIADLNNNSSDSYAGAISAALFLKEFVPDTIPWLHYDMMAWNLRARPGRPQGGEAVSLRAVFHYLSETYSLKK